MKGIVRIGLGMELRLGLGIPLILGVPLRRSSLFLRFAKVRVIVIHGAHLLTIRHIQKRVILKVHRRRRRGLRARWEGTRWLRNRPERKCLLLRLLMLMRLGTLTSLAYRTIVLRAGPFIETNRGRRRPRSILRARTRHLNHSGKRFGLLDLNVRRRSAFSTRRFDLNHARYVLVTDLDRIRHLE